MVQPFKKCGGMGQGGRVASGGERTTVGGSRDVAEGPNTLEGGWLQGQRKNSKKQAGHLGYAWISLSVLLHVQEWGNQRQLVVCIGFNIAVKIECIYITFKVNLKNVGLYVSSLLQRAKMLKSWMKLHRCVSATASP